MKISIMFLIVLIALIMVTAAIGVGHKSSKDHKDWDKYKKINSDWSNYDHKDWSWDKSYQKDGKFSGCGQHSDMKQYHKGFKKDIKPDWEIYNYMDSGQSYRKYVIYG